MQVKEALLQLEEAGARACEWRHTRPWRADANLRAMTRYRISSRVMAIAEDLYHVSVVASREDTPREGVIARRQECSSRHGAEQIREILVNQVSAAVMAAGGRIVSLEGH
jgi:hypothetical protein